jgi:MFS transporter, DHA2 family, methylenomycin A resistance protein
MRNTMLLGWGIGALVALVMVALGRNSSHLVIVVFASILTFEIGSAIPVMTATMMQMAGKQYANSAAAALNANRQIGALVGVAVVGTILHAVAAWDQRVHLSFICFFLAYGLAGLLVYRYIHSATTQDKATPVLNEL